MAGIDTAVTAQREYFFLQRSYYLFEISRGIGPARSSRKKCITGKKNIFMKQTDAAGRMAGSMQDLQRKAA